MEFQQSRGGREGAFRKEGERIAIDGIAQNPARIGSATVPVEALYKMRAEPTKQQSREGHAIHFPLDDEREPRR